MKKIAVIGVRGRTGTMFAFELKNSVEILGVDREKEVKVIKEEKFFIKRKGKPLELFKEKVIKDIEFEENLKPDILFLTTKNPVSPPIQYYYQKFKEEKMPDLILSQNGIGAIEEAKEVLKEIFGEESEKIRIIRISLFNPVDRKEIKNRIYIKYSLPIRIAIAKVFGPGGIEDVVEIFENAGFETWKFPDKEVKNLEFSKLFLNLIGISSASRGFSIEEGFKNPEILREELEALREYIKVVRTAKGKFLNFPHYPVKFLVILIKFLPMSFFLIFRKILAEIVSERREEKSKDLNQIEFYNGAVVKLGKKLGIRALINEKIYKRVIEKLRKC